VGGTDTWATVPDWLVGERELAGVVADHLGLDFNLVEDLSVVDGQDAADHLWQDDHVAQMGLDNGGLLQRLALLLRLAQLLEQGQRLALQAARVSPARSAVEHLGELVALGEQKGVRSAWQRQSFKGRLLRGLVQESIQVDASVRVLAEGSFLLELDGIVYVSNNFLSKGKSRN
jgi:hypothetical protein